MITGPTGAEIRLTAWIRDFGTQKEPPFIADLTEVLRLVQAYRKAATPSDEPYGGMMCSLPGVLLRAAETCRLSDNSHLEFPLKELLEHLALLRDAPSRHKRFFQIWSDDR